MSEWKTYRMEDVAELCLGKMLDAKKNKGTLRPYLNNVSVRWGSFDLSDLPMMRFEDSEIERYVARKGDIVACEGGEPGRCAMWKSDTPIFLQKAVHRIRVKKGFDPCFVYYDFRYLVTSGKTAHLETGSTIRHLPGQALKEVELAIPDLPTQRRIAAVLGALDDKIENNRKICENLEAQAQALFKSWFVDFEPWGGKMPEGWKKGKLRDIAGYDNRRIAASNLTVETYFSTENMLTDRGGVVAVASIPQSGEVPLCEEGSVLVSNIRPYFKKIYRATETAGHSADVLCFEAKDSSWQWYLYRLLWDDAFFAYVMSGVKGCKMPRGDKEQILDYGCVIPGADNVAEFNAVVEPMCQRITHCNKESRALAEMRDALLPQLMSGRLRVDATACQGEIDVGKVEI